MLCISLGVVGIIVNYTDIYYTTLDTHTHAHIQTHIHNVHSIYLVDLYYHMNKYNITEGLRNI